MAGLENYQNWDYVIPANGSVRIATIGEYVMCLEATAAFEISVDDAPGQFLTGGLGFFAPAGEGFKNVTLTDTSGLNNTVKLAIGRGDFRDARLSLTGDVNISVSSSVEDLADATIATATQDAIASSAGQREIIIQADPDNIGNLRVAASAAAGRGVWLQPGQSLTLATTAAVYVTNASGVNQVYSYMKVIS